MGDKYIVGHLLWQSFQFDKDGFLYSSFKPPVFSFKIIMTYDTSKFKGTVSTALCFNLYLPKKSNNFKFDMQWHKFLLYLKPLSMVLWSMHKMWWSFEYNYTGRNGQKCLFFYLEKMGHWFLSPLHFFLLGVQSQHNWRLSGLIFLLSEKIFGAICSCNNFHRPENCLNLADTPTDWFVNRTHRVVNGL